MVSALLSGAAGGAAVNVVIRATDRFSKTLDKATSKFGKFGKGMATIAKVGVAAFATAGVAATGFGVSALKAASANQEIEKSFHALADGSNDFIKQLKDVTKGTVSSFNLMSSANRALLLGIEQNKLPDLFENAIKLGKAAGRSATEAIEDITVGIGRQSPLILDNLGITFKASEAYEEYAKSIGKSVNELSDSEKRLAFQEKAIASLNSKAEELGATLGTSFQDKLSIMKATFDDLKVSIGSKLLPVFTSFAQTLLDNKDTILGFARSIFDFFKPIGKFLIDTILGAFERVKSAIPTLKEAFETVKQFLQPLIDIGKEVITTVLDKLKSTFLNLTASLQENKAPIMDVFTSLRNILGTVFSIIGSIFGVLLDVFNFLIDIGAIDLIVAAFRVLLKVLENILNIIKGVFDFVVKLINKIANSEFGKTVANVIEGGVSGLASIGNSLFGGDDAESVNDFILTSKGKLIKTHPEDNLIGFKGNTPNFGQGKGITINIGTVQGLNADEIARALQQKLRGLITL